MPIFTIFAFSAANDVDGAVEAGLCFVRLPVTNRQIGWGLETVDKETKGRYVELQRQYTRHCDLYNAYMAVIGGAE
jgi:hypothetical protein